MKYVCTLLLTGLLTGRLTANPDSLTYKNLVFEGGGVRGIAYAGALKVLEERGLLQSVERVGGTSVGAVTGTNLTAQQTVVFSHEHTPDLPLKTAVRISMSIPLYFGAVFMDEQGQIVRRPRKERTYQILVDGGLTANYPIDLFDTAGRPNPETLGLKLERPAQIRQSKTGDEIAPYSIRNVNDYLSAFTTMSSRI